MKASRIELSEGCLKKRPTLLQPSRVREPWPIKSLFIGLGSKRSVSRIDFSVFRGELTQGPTDVLFVGASGLVAVCIEDLDARIRNGIVTRCDHASHACLKRQHCVVQGGRSAFTNMDHSTSCQPQALRERLDQSDVVRASIPADDHDPPGPRQCWLGVREGFAQHPHEGGREGTFFLKTSNCSLFVERIKRCFSANSIGAKEGAHVHSSAMLTVVLVDAGYGDVWPNHAVAAQHDTGVGHAVASQCTTFTKQRSEFSQSARDAFTADPEMDLASVVSKVAEFGSSAEVHVSSKDRIAHVIEMWGFGSRKENAVLDLGRMTDHRIGANPRVFSHISAASNNGSGSDITGADEVCTGFNHRRGVDDDAFATDEEPWIFTRNTAVKISHLPFKEPLSVGLSTVHAGPLAGSAGVSPSSSLVKEGKRAAAEADCLPVHAKANEPLGINVVMAQAARW